MQEQLTTYRSAAAVAPTADITGALFNDFVTWIDRSEKTARTYLVNLRQFMAWLCYTDTRRPVRQDIILYRDYLTREHDAIIFDPLTPQKWRYRTDSAGNRQTVTCKPNTVKQYLQSVRQFFTWAAANNLYPNIAANIHAPKITESHKKDALTPQEVLTIERSIEAGAATRTAAAEEAAKDKAGRVQRSTEQGKRLYAMYLLAVNAGLRTVELSRANIKDLETKGGKTWLYVWGKGHNEADAKKPIAPEVKAALDDYLRSRSDKPTGSAPLFVSTGNRSRGKRIAPTTISTMLKQAMQEAGFDSERITAHSLRHTTGQTVMSITGNNIYDTQMYMRHSSPKTTEIYLENDSAAKDETIAQQLYNRYHGIEESAGSRDQLESLITVMTPAQIAQLAALAAALTK